MAHQTLRLREFTQKFIIGCTCEITDSTIKECTSCVVTRMLDGKKFYVHQMTIPTFRDLMDGSDITIVYGLRPLA
jgi:hypothetical protein